MSFKTKLFVDDVREAPEGWTLAQTINEAINFISRFRPEEISLDHDKGHFVEGDDVQRACDECFCAVACFIGVYYQEGHVPSVTLHTANSEGAEKMRGILDEFGIEAKIFEKPS